MAPLQINIFWPNPSQALRALDLIRGVVVVRGPVTIPDGIVTITLTGTSHTVQVQPRRTVTDDEIFFSLPYTLYQGGIDIAADTAQEFPFEIRIPQVTQGPGAGVEFCTKKSGRKGELNEPLYALGPHELPPTCTLGGRWGERGWNARVRYVLKAKATSTQKGSIFKEKVKKSGVAEVPLLPPLPPPPPLPMVPEEEEAEKDGKKEKGERGGKGENTGKEVTMVDVRSKAFEVASSNLLRAPTEEAAGKAKKRTMSKWFSDKVGSDTPKAVFYITARTVTTLTAGQEIPIQLLLQYDQAKTNLQTLPDLKLTEVKYKVKGLTDLVSRRLLGAEQQLSDKATVFKRTLRFDSLSLVAGANLDIGLPLQDGSGVGHLTLDAQLPEEFKTYNVYRRYMIEATVEFECAGKKMSALFEWKPLRIVHKEGYVGDPALAFNMSGETMGSILGAVTMVRVLVNTAGLIAAVV